MSNLYVFSSINCESCKGVNKSALFFNQGKPYGKNFYKIPDPIVTSNLGTLNFVSYSLSDTGLLVYKSNGTKVELQPLKLNNMDTLYMTDSGLGI